MGLEVSVSERTEPDNSSNWTNERTYSWDSQELFKYKVKKAAYREPPIGFSLEWETLKSNKEVSLAVLNFYLSLRKRYGIPADARALEVVEEIRDLAYRKASVLKADGARLNLNKLSLHREAIEPFHACLSITPEFDRNLFFVSDKPQVGIEAMRRQMTSRLSRPPFMAATFRSPFANIVLEEGASGKRKRVLVESRYKIPNEVLELFQATSEVVINIHQRSQINERLRKPISLLPKPDKAA